MSEFKGSSKDIGMGCSVATLILLGTPLWALYRGWVMLQLYNWFILPIKGAPVMALGNLVGISLLLSMCLAGLATEKDENSSEQSITARAISSLMKILLYPALFLFFGWLYQMWFM